MNTKQIDAVLELAKTLNFNRAAEKLHFLMRSLDQLNMSETGQELQ